MQAIASGWGRLEVAGGGCRRLGTAAGGWKQLKAAPGGWRRLEVAGGGCRRLGADAGGCKRVQAAGGGFGQLTILVHGEGLRESSTSCGAGRWEFVSMVNYKINQTWRSKRRSGRYRSCRKITTYIMFVEYVQERSVVKET